MMARSHFILGGVGWCGWCLVTGTAVDPAGLGVAAAAALLPDIDHPQSTVGRRLPWLSRPISAVFGHRGLTHSLLALAAVVCGLVWVHQAGSGAVDLRRFGLPIAPDATMTLTLIQAAAIGYLSHLAGDALTPSGVPLFWPWRRCFSLNLFRTGGIAETAAVLLLAGSMSVIYIEADPDRADRVRSFIDRHADIALPSLTRAVVPSSASPAMSS